MERAISLDPRSPFVLDTHDLARRPGTMRTLERVVPAPEDLGIAVIGIPAGTDVELDLRLEAVMEGILVSGKVRGRAVGECVRCLEEVVDEVDADLQELYYYPDRARVAAEEGDDEDEIRELEGELLDLEPAVRDAVVTALPFRPVCMPDCPGLCPHCGARLADPENADHTHEVIDPRWGELERMKTMFDDQRES
ncbi:YceD family protein [Cellulomonas carbonis]|uniref:Metal-binding protein n=1 Tax=Cellulomonas carbonis T26 TaxID=947969 RepID=A0A0A0BQE4_9CELL|nr:DUF177 domain-containing protein [Cellulomonas carbonis]KGM09294.1 metal-binding protein [Cellulomonas carbonis T26]GGC12735.1 hypothetical protein GCM10010972_27600 [Cellulomonas carbonis]